MSEATQADLSYEVTVTRQDRAHAVAQTRGHSLTLNVKKGDGAAGFNAAETLMAALGTCLLTNVNSLAEKMRLQINAARVEISAERSDKPAKLTRLAYRLVLESPEPIEALEELHTLAVKWGTVTNTIHQGIAPQGELTILRPEA